MNTSPWLLILIGPLFSAIVPARADFPPPACDAPGPRQVCVGAVVVPAGTECHFTVIGIRWVYSGPYAPPSARYLITPQEGESCAETGRTEVARRSIQLRVNRLADLSVGSLVRTYAGSSSRQNCDGRIVELYEQGSAVITATEPARCDWSWRWLSATQYHGWYSPLPDDGGVDLPGDVR